MKKLKWILFFLCLGGIVFYFASTVEVASGIENGHKIPNIKGENTLGKKIDLYQIKSEYILVDFWASWCAPCRAMNPELVSLAKNFNQEKLTILSISLDEDKDKWQNAIQKDGLIWETHICDFKGWYSPIAAQFGIETIPSNILINKEKIIIGKNLKTIEVLGLIK